MSKVLDKMGKQMPERLPGLGVLLAAVGTVALFYGMAAVLALMIVTQFLLAHDLNRLAGFGKLKLLKKCENLIGVHNLIINKNCLSIGKGY